MISTSTTTPISTYQLVPFLMAPNFHSHSLLLLPLLLCLPSHTTASARCPALIVFGDSTVDAGNNNQIRTLLKSNFPPYGRDLPERRPTGRFCNGRLATDFISEALGLPPLVPAYLDLDYTIADFVKGVSFASAGTGLDNATSDVLNVIPLWKEVEYFKEYQARLRRHVGETQAQHIVSEAVYMVSIGTNDFLENYYILVTGRHRQFTVGGFQDFLLDRAAEFLTAIYRLGARKVAFVGLAPIGCLPLERTANLLKGGRCIDEYNKAARGFNVKLQALIQRLNAKLPELRLRYAPVYDGLLRIIQSPSSYGIENVKRGCCASGRFEMSYLCAKWSPFNNACPDADKYVFWDSFHPTEKINRLIAEQTLNSSLSEMM
ncbi:GDSL esterase/lipase [Canna indica]|uniref:GDSL esterase/lipase n=1 Tax=Canna indica TaxID=4628 RepID=A0AAQ3JSW4_9LILI|nr:GDSL esterase/lipase [Canna indica]